MAGWANLRMAQSVSPPGQGRGMSEPQGMRLSAARIRASHAAPAYQDQWDDPEQTLNTDLADEHGLHGGDKKPLNMQTDTIIIKLCVIRVHLLNLC